MDDAKREKYLQKTYNISLAEFQKLAENGCMVCGRSPKTRSLHVDHDHRISKLKIQAYWDGGGWLAMCEALPWLGTNWHQKKYTATRELRHRLKRLSVRGVLDWRCNAALKKIQDNPIIADGLASYLRRYETRLSQKEIQ